MDKSPQRRAMGRKEGIKARTMALRVSAAVLGTKSVERCVQRPEGPAPPSRPSRPLSP